MITATQITSALNAAKTAEKQTQILMPTAYFDLEGMDSNYIYFKVLAKLYEISEVQIKSMKLRFSIVEENDQGVYRGIFKMAIEDECLSELSLSA
ncbi:hypothetical protein [Fulvivirga sediminis]|uniref:Uncharacterized protein n=1 Tax=Fulvivirga sediminis TaxID=2803949 RepID=A0A937FBB0_9BACT|nr:hypothetical protein [Fulvivirga sediminis]MBL3657679.1 hypothetical protein [Fulvivirga sediminis]